MMIGLLTKDPEAIVQKICNCYRPDIMGVRVLSLKNSSI